MYPTASFASYQQRRVGSYRIDSDSYCFFNLLTSDAVSPQFDYTYDGSISPAGWYQAAKH